MPEAHLAALEKRLVLADAEAIGAVFGLDPGAHRLRRRLRRSAQFDRARLSQGRRRGDPRHARLPGLSDRHARGRRQAGGGAGEELYAQCRLDPGGGDRQDQGRLRRQSEQSDRHLYSVRRGEAAASRPAAACAARARRGLCRICPAQRLRVRHRTGRHLRQCRDVPHLLEDLRLGGAAARLDVRAAACGRRDQPHPRAVQRQRAGDRRRRRGDPRFRACRARARAQFGMARLAHGRDRQARPGSDAERGEFRAHPFPRDAGQDRQGGRRLPHQARPDPAAGDRLQAAQCAAHDRSAAKRPIGSWCRR